MIEQQPEKPVRPIRVPAEFQRVVGEAMDLYRQLEAVDAEEKVSKAAAVKSADTKRGPLLLRYERRMDRVMAYVRTNHPEVFKGGDKDKFETDELIVRFHKDGNGTLDIQSEAALIAYSERRKELRSHHVKLIKSFVNASKFKQWMRANPTRRPPAHISYNDSISFIRKLTTAEKARGVEPAVLKRIISES